MQKAIGKIEEGFLNKKNQIKSRKCEAHSIQIERERCYVRLSQLLFLSTYIYRCLIDVLFAY